MDDGRTNTSNGGFIYEALELAEQAYEAHALPYQAGLSNMQDYSPRRFRWVYDDEAENFVRVLDTETNKLADWPCQYPPLETK